MKNFLVCFYLLAALGSAPAFSQAKANKHMYSKPGAAVALIDDGQINIDTAAEQSVVMDFSSAYNGQQLVVTVKSSEGLQVINNQNLWQVLVENNKASLPLTLFAAEPGLYDLMFHINAKTAGVIQRRVVGVAVQVGSVSAGVGLKQKAFPKIISLPAEERSY